MLTVDEPTGVIEYETLLFDGVDMYMCWSSGIALELDAP